MYINALLESVVSEVVDSLDSKLNAAVSSAKEDINSGSDSINYDGSTDSDSDSTSTDSSTTTTTLVQ